MHLENDLILILKNSEKSSNCFSIIHSVNCIWVNILFNQYLDF